MSGELEMHVLPDGTEVATGLLLPNEQEKLLMAQLPEYPDSMYLDSKDIERRLVINGQQRYLASRKKRQHRKRNQGRLGKCNGSSNASGLMQLRETQGMPEIALSDCYIYSLANGGRDQGSALITTLSQLQQAQGTAPMELVVDGKTVMLPNNFYNRSQVDRKVLAVADSEARRFVGFEFYKAPLDSFENYCRCLASAIAREHPVIYAWHVGNSSMQIKNGYVQVGHGPGNHSNLFHDGKWVGGKTLVHPDDDNSWGPCVNKLYGDLGGNWGDGGYALFTMEDAYACAHNHCTYIMTSVKVDPKDPAFA